MTRNFLGLLLAATLLLNAFDSQAMGQSSEICNGCSDSSTIGAIPPPASKTVLFDLLYVITYSGTVQQMDGICTKQEVPGSSSSASYCAQSVPCSPHVSFYADIDDQIAYPFEEVTWSVSGSGWVGYDQVDPRGDHGVGDKYVTLYDEGVRLECGASLQRTATYTIVMDPSTTPFFYGEVSNWSASFDCGTCFGIVYE